MSGNIAKKRGRWRRVVLFLTVVWSIGGSFLLIQTLSINVLDFALRRSGNPLGLPAQSAQARAHCGDVVAHLPSLPRGLLPNNEARYAAWRLGLELGVDFSSQDAGRMTADQAAKALVDVQEYAHKLGVPEVALPQASQAAYRLSAFTFALEEDAQCVAAALSSRYTKQHAALYQFGASVGVAYVYRLSVPEAGAVLGLQIRRYGSSTGLPETLWAPFTEDPPKDESARTQTVSVLRNIEQTLKAAATPQ